MPWFANSDEEAPGAHPPALAAPLAPRRRLRGKQPPAAMVGHKRPAAALAADGAAPGPAEEQRHPRP
eukprot:15448526-Alexandrium_andersonii.AAC.1